MLGARLDLLGYDACLLFPSSPAHKTRAWAGCNRIANTRRLIGYCVLSRLDYLIRRTIPPGLDFTNADANMMQQTQPLQDNKEDIIAQLLAQNDELLKALQDCVVEMDTLKQRVQNVDRTDSSTMTDGARLAVDSSMQVDEGTLDMHKLVEDLLVSSLESVVDDTTMDTVSLSADLIAIPSEPEESMMNMRVPTLEAKHADNPVDIAPPVTPISARPDSVQREVMEFAAVGLRNVLPVDEDESEKDVAAAVQDAVELEEKDVAATVPEVIVSSDDSDHVSTMRSVPTTLNGSKRIALQKRDKDVNESTRPRRVSTTVTTTTTMTTSMKRSSRRRSRFNSDATGPSTFRASITEEQVRKATYAFKRMSLAMKAPSDEHATIADTEEVILARPRQSMFSSPRGNTPSPIIEGVAVEVKADALLPASARSPLSGSQIPATDPASIPATPEERIAMLSAIGVDLHATVRNSTICLNAQGKEYLTFVIGVSRHTENMDHQVWSVQKRYTDLAGLHDLLCKTQSMEVMRSIGKDVVHKSLFALGDVSPSRAAKRKQTLQRYLNAAIDSVLTAAENIEPLLWFFSTNVVELEGTGSAPVFNDSLKEGYLTKKGQKLGGWVCAFVVD